MRTQWLVCIDDTDNLESIGTGKLARWLAAHLVRAGLLSGATVTRHQLLLHREVPYTSHNSSACISASGAPEVGDHLIAEAQRFLARHQHAGANPGLCVCDAARVPGAIGEIGRRAQRQVLDLDEFDLEVAPHGLRIWSHGETGQGRIGAVCGVGLRASGEDGRFIELRGIRDVGGRASISEILARTGVEAIVDEAGRGLDDDVEIDTRDWIRPSLRGGRAVFVVRRDGDDWVPFERRSKDDG